jgi:hypothetical protein
VSTQLRLSKLHRLSEQEVTNVDSKSSGTSKKTRKRSYQDRDDDDFVPDDAYEYDAEARKKRKRARKAFTITCVKIFPDSIRDGHQFFDGVIDGTRAGKYAFLIRDMSLIPECFAIASVIKPEILIAEHVSLMKKTVGLFPYAMTPTSMLMCLADGAWTEAGWAPSDGVCGELISSDDSLCRHNKNRHLPNLSRKGSMNLRGWLRCKFLIDCKISG